MPGILDFFTDDVFLPHAICLVENPSLIRLHIASDATTAAAYYSIPLALGYFAYRRREDIPFSWMFTLFGAFILLCGTTHLFGIWTLYVPDYYSQGILKAATGLASIGTAIVTWKLMPALLLLPGPEKLKKLNSELESLVAARTSELEAALREKEALLAQAYHRAAIVASSDDAIIAFDLCGRITEWNHAAEKLLGRPADEMIGRDVRAGGFALAEDFSRVAEKIGERETVEAFDTGVKTEAGRLDVSVQASPIRDASGSVQGVSIIARDLAERLRGEARMRTVMMEVDHRAKNMLAVVAAMIRMTRRDPACEPFVETIQGRIDALAAAHSAIVENKWDGAKVSEVVDKTLAPFAGARQVAFRGWDAFIAPVAVQALGIVLHELATNAVKHGALSREGGKVFIDLRRLENGDLEIAWQERGGPPASPPERISFGMRLIRTYIPNQLEGSTEMEWGEGGLTARLGIPAGYVI